jgi:hypothetical protein
MISRKIAESARFLKMPATTQNLYFHLVLNADDDGIVEAYSVIALCKANEDDLKLLMAKQFVFVLNEDLVTYIEDWREQNVLRPDRKTDSRYKHLLLKIRPDVKLLERRQRSDVKRKIIDGGQSVDGPRTEQANLIEMNINQYNSVHPSVWCFETEGQKDEEKWRKFIAENIDLESLRAKAKLHNQTEVKMVDEIYETICDMVCNPRETVTIKGTAYPWSTVKSQFLKLDYQKIANILNRIIDADLHIKNMNAYLISTLYMESLSGTLAEEAGLHDDYLKTLRGKPYL